MKSLALVVFLGLGSIAHAAAPAAFEKMGFSSETEMQNYLTVSDFKVTKTAINDRELAAVINAPIPVDAAVTLGNSFLDSLGPVLLTPENPAAWIAFGKKAWEVVVANKPVLDVTSAKISVLPTEKADWAKMAGWRGPRGLVYGIQAVNGFGVTVVDQKYTVAYNYGGSMNGQGHYLANATIIPSTISVAWAYTLNSNVEVGQILNAGTVANPIPAVDLQLTYHVKTILKETQGVDSFNVKGDGSLTHVSKSL